MHITHTHTYIYTHIYILILPYFLLYISSSSSSMNPSIDEGQDDRLSNTDFHFVDDGGQHLDSADPELDLPPCDDLDPFLDLDDSVFFSLISDDDNGYDEALITSLLSDLGHDNDEHDEALNILSFSPSLPNPLSSCSSGINEYVSSEPIQYNEKDEIVNTSASSSVQNLVYSSETPKVVQNLNDFSSETLENNQNALETPKQVQNTENQLARNLGSNICFDSFSTDQSGCPDVDSYDPSVIRMKRAFICSDDKCDLNPEHKRKCRNRQLAFESRQRRKSYISDLEAKCRKLEWECNDIQRQACLTFAENTVLKEELSQLKKMKGNHNGATVEPAVLFQDSLPLEFLLLIICLCLHLVGVSQCVHPFLVSMPTPAVQRYGIQLEIGKLSKDVVHTRFLLFDDWG